MKAGLLIALWLAAAPASNLEAARQEYARSEAALQSAHATVAAQQTQLDALSNEIARAKSQQAGQPALFVPSELQKKLAQSQALAAALDASRADERARAADDEKARAALHDALSGEISARESRGAADPAALAELQRLEAERAQVAPSAGAQVQAPTFSKPSDDPKELRERADALHDQADKLSRQELAVQQRIQAARDQLQLDRQLRRLSGDDALFDESDRRVRVSRTDSASAAVGGSSDRTASASPGLGTTPTAGSPGKQGGGTMTDAQNQPGAGAFTPGPGGVAVGSPTPSVSASAQELGSSVTRSGELVRPDDFSRGQASASDDDDSLPALLAAQKKLERERAQLEAQAKALEAQAAGK